VIHSNHDYRCDVNSPWFGAQRQAGQTVCDIWGDSERVKNVLVAKVRRRCSGTLVAPHNKQRYTHPLLIRPSFVRQAMDVPAFWRLMLHSLRQCNAVTAFNAFVAGGPTAAKL
jgi:hypothetical protein